MSRNLKSIVVLLAVFDTVMCVVLLALQFAPKADPVTAAAQPAEFTGTVYLPLVLVERGETLVVVVVDEPVQELVRVERPIRIEKPVTDPCDSRNNPDGNPDPHPCPKRNSGQAEQAPWPMPDPSPEQPKTHQQQSQPEAGKRGH